MANQIQVKGGFRREEALASGTVKPGMLLALTSAGAVIAHATEGGFAERAFAVEDALQGNTVDDSYADGELVSFNLVEPGAEVYAWVYAGESIVIGDELVSKGNGMLIEATSVTSGVTVEQVVAIALEAADLNDSGDVSTLVKVRVL